MESEEGLRETEEVKGRMLQIVQDVIEVLVGKGGRED